ncbi:MULTISPECIES: hypothetical protein [Stenotrophomonas]|uniref:hypothetical protein n=1 Tax=Stenotrophomonas TaxID=40323 RepID=UPI0012E3F041|nr:MULTISPECIES: hypothetical protein [Stenotrophomonas]
MNADLPASKVRASNQERDMPQDELLHDMLTTLDRLIAVFASATPDEKSWRDAITEMRAIRASLPASAVLERFVGKRIRQSLDMRGLSLTNGPATRALLGPSIATNLTLARQVLEGYLGKR